MEEKKLLKEIGLNNYEVEVYLKLVESGVAEASALYKDAKVPFGRIYEVLNSLVSKGLIEIQDTRPKKYMIKKPRIAFGSLLKNKKDDMENQFQKTLETVSKVEESILKRMPAKPRESAFWTVAVGNNEIVEMMKYNFEEAEKELCIITRSQVENRRKQLALAFQPEILNSLIGAVKRGVKLRVLIGERFEIPENIIEKEKLKLLLNKIEIKTIQEIKSYFEICDNSKVMIKIDNPANSKEILATIRIYDIKLARELKEKFEELWAKAKPVRFSS